MLSVKILERVYTKIANCYKTQFLKQSYSKEIVQRREQSGTEC
jgi:hypothetical protein